MGLIDSQLAKWATAFSGCDGGDIGSPQSKSIWFCGIEWGGGHPDDELELRDIFTEDVGKPAVGYIDDDGVPAWRANLAYIFNWQAMKLFAAIHGQQVSTYKSFAEEVKPFVKNERGYYKLNLYPLAFRNTSHQLWQDGFAKATGFERKQEYIDWIRSHRFPIMKSWTQSYAPKLIICAGITYSSDFRMAFVDEGLDFNRETHDDRELQWVVNKNGTTVVVIPFMVNRNGLTRNVSIQKFGDRIREIIS
jgi:hypothetical protein